MKANDTNAHHKALVRTDVTQRKRSLIEKSESYLRELVLAISDTLGTNRPSHRNVRVLVE